MNLQIKTDPAFESVLDNYPDMVQDQMRALRQLVLDTAAEIPEVTVIEETLKWGEPSFITKHGSTLRMDWKSKNPEQYAMYFKCTSRLVETFRLVYGDVFNYEKNRAIWFRLDEPTPKDALKKCIQATLMYHKVKGDSMLGL